VHSASAPSESLPAEDVLFARQPIFDADRRLAGYELLDVRPAAASPDDGIDAAASRVALAAITEVGLRTAAGGATAHLNVTGRLLELLEPLPFGPEGVVLEVRAEPATDALVRRLTRLRNEGYVLALDEFAFQPDTAPLVDLAQIVKIDVGAIGDHGLDAAAARLRGVPGRLLALGVDGHELQEACAAVGFELFQGDFHRRPRVVAGRAVPVSDLTRLRVAAGLSGTESTLEDIERAISLDVGLSFRLLRYLNSAALSLPNRISTVRQAILMLGERAVRQWVMLLVLSGAGGERDPLVVTALARGRMCEAIARRLGAPDPDAYFVAGLFSMVDALLDAPLDQVLGELPLADDIEAALLERAGGKGRALRMAEACERGAAEEVAVVDADAEVLARLHTAALRWADNATAGLAATHLDE
jgi:EAL and modified HD-GYP domain-containing signal transduction protein